MNNIFRKSMSGWRLCLREDLERIKEISKKDELKNDKKQI